MFKSYQVMTGAAMAALLAAGCKSAEDYKASLESILSELAQSEYLQDTHTVFQSDVDRAWEEIMAS